MSSARRLACLIGAAMVAALPPLPASAQQSWLDKIFSSEKPQPVAPVAPVASAPAPSAPPAAGRPASPMPPKRPASDSKEAAQTAPPAITATPAPQPPIVTAAAPAVEAPSTPLTDRQIIERANAYFNGISVLTGDFVQMGGDGRRLSGKLYLQRPGKIRFEYNPPATLEVIADGSSVAVRDRKLATQDLFSIGQTPLKFLLRDRVDLAKDVRIVDAGIEAEEARIALEDKSTIGGTSKITLFFDRNVQTLTRWRIVDPQGFLTTVALANLDKSRRVDPRLFVINYERMLGEGSNR